MLVVSVFALTLAATPASLSLSINNNNNNNNNNKLIIIIAGYCMLFVSVFALTLAAASALFIAGCCWTCTRPIAASVLIVAGDYEPTAM